MTGRLAGKKAFVTAAAQGIGRAMVEAFAAEGATVVASDLDEKKLGGLPKGATGKRLDVTDTAAVDAIAKEVGAVDILANVAGWVHHGSILECSEADWDRSFDINVTSMYRVCRAFLPKMLE